MTVPADYATIGEDVAAARSGDTVCIEAGTYAEAIDLEGKRVTVRGAGSALTVLQPALAPPRPDPVALAMID